MNILRIVAISTVLWALVATAGLTQDGSSAPGKMATGRIVSIDAPAQAVTLENGQTYRLPSVEYLDAIKIGDTITVEYTSDTKGTLVVTDLMILS